MFDPKVPFGLILTATHGLSLTRTNSQLTCSYSKVPCLGIIFCNTEEKSSQTKNKPKTACFDPKVPFWAYFFLTRNNHIQQRISPNGMPIYKKITPKQHVRSQSAFLDLF